MKDMSELTHFQGVWSLGVHSYYFYLCMDDIGKWTETISTVEVSEYIPIIYTMVYEGKEWTGTISTSLWRIWVY